MPEPKPKRRSQRAAETGPIGALQLSGAARYLDVSPITIRRLIDRGLVRPCRGTRRMLFPIAELDRFLASDIQAAQFGIADPGHRVAMAKSKSAGSQKSQGNQ